MRKKQQKSTKSCSNGKEIYVIIDVTQEKTSHNSGGIHMILYMAMLDTDEDKQKFSAVYHKYRYFLWYLANERLKDAMLAEDAVQETFFALTRHMDRIQDPDAVSTRNFLATITKNKALDMLRKHTEEPTEDVQTKADIKGEDALETCICRESYEELCKAIEALDEIYRVVFEYKYLHELSDGEIADLLGITKKTVNVRIFRARKKLQAILTQTGGAK